MYTEFIKIIEGGLSGDREKVYNYCNTLVKNLASSGDIKLARKIQTLLDEKRGGRITLDTFQSNPVDIESRIDMIKITYPTVLLEDLILNPMLKNEIERFIFSYKKRDELIKAGVSIENNVLLYGPPGCGKTSIAQAIANQLDLPLLTVRLDGLISSLLGSTAKNIHKIFEYASKRECVLFLDEFDVIAKLRDDKNELGELKRVVNSLIQNIDMFDSNSILIAATNHQELLDSAIWRRFNNIISICKPSLSEISLYLELLQQKYEVPYKLSKKENKSLCELLNNRSFSDIFTIFNNTIKNCVITSSDYSFANIIKEVYCYTHHNIVDETFIEFLIKNNISIRNINKCFGYSIRQIQKISNKMHLEE